MDERMTLEQVRDFLLQDAVYWINQSGKPVVQARMLRNYADAIDAHLAQPAQATTCAGCGKHKPTPLRIDAMGGYVCLTCIDEKLSSLLGEFGYHEAQPAQAVDVGAIREVIAELTRRANTGFNTNDRARCGHWATQLTRAIGNAQVAD